MEETLCTIDSLREKLTRISQKVHQNNITPNSLEYTNSENHLGTLKKKLIDSSKNVLKNLPDSVATSISLSITTLLTEIQIEISKSYQNILSSLLACHTEQKNLDYSPLFYEMSRLCSFIQEKKDSPNLSQEELFFKWEHNVDDLLVLNKDQIKKIESVPTQNIELQQSTIPKEPNQSKETEKTEEKLGEKPGKIKSLANFLFRSKPNSEKKIVYKMNLGLQNKKPYYNYKLKRWCVEGEEPPEEEPMVEPPPMLNASTPENENTSADISNDAASSTKNNLSQSFIETSTHLENNKKKNDNLSSKGAGDLLKASDSSRVLSRRKGAGKNVEKKKEILKAGLWNPVDVTTVGECNEILLNTAQPIEEKVEIEEKNLKNTIKNIIKNNIDSTGNSNFENVLNEIFDIHQNLNLFLQKQLTKAKASIKILKLKYALSEKNNSSQIIQNNQKHSTESKAYKSCCNIGIQASIQPQEKKNLNKNETLSIDNLLTNFEKIYKNMLSISQEIEKNPGEKNKIEIKVPETPSVMLINKVICVDDAESYHLLTDYLIKIKENLNSINNNYGAVGPTALEIVTVAKKLVEATAEKLQGFKDQNFMLHKEICIMKNDINNFKSDLANKDVIIKQHEHIHEQNSIKEKNSLISLNNFNMNLMAIQEENKKLITELNDTKKELNKIQHEHSQAMHLNKKMEDMYNQLQIANRKTEEEAKVLELEKNKYQTEYNNLYNQKLIENQDSQKLQNELVKQRDEMIQQNKIVHDDYNKLMEELNAIKDIERDKISKEKSQEYESTIEELKAELKKNILLKSKIEEENELIKNEIIDLKTKIDNQKQSLQHYEINISKLNQENENKITDLNNIIQSKETKINHLSKDFEELKEEFNTKIHKSNEENTNIQNIIKNLSEEKASLKNLIELQDKKLKESFQTITHLKTILSQSKSVFGNRIKYMEQQQTDIQIKLQEATNKYLELEKNYFELEIQHKKDTAKQNYFKQIKEKFQGKEEFLVPYDFLVTFDENINKPETFSMLNKFHQNANLLKNTNSKGTNLKPSTENIANLNSLNELLSELAKKLLGESAKPQQNFPHIVEPLSNENINLLPNTCSIIEELKQIIQQQKDLEHLKISQVQDIQNYLVTIFNQVENEFQVKLRNLESEKALLAEKIKDASERLTKFELIFKNIHKLPADIKTESSPQKEIHTVDYVDDMGLQLTKKLKQKVLNISFDNELAQRMKKIEKDNINKNQLINSLKSMNEEYQTIVNESKNKAFKIEEEYKILEQEKAELIQKYEDSLHKLISYQDQNKMLIESKNQLQQINEKYSIEISRLTELQQTYQNDLTHIKNINTELENQLTVSAQEYSVLQSELLQCQNSTKLLVESSSNHENGIEILRSENLLLAAENGNLKKEVCQLKDDKIKLSSQLAENESKNQLKIDELFNEVERKNSWIFDLEKAIEELKSKTSNNEENQITIDYENESLFKAEVENLQIQIYDKQRLIESYTNEMNDLRAINEEKEKELNLLRGMKYEIESLKIQIKSNEEQKKAEIEKLENELDEIYEFKKKYNLVYMDYVELKSKYEGLTKGEIDQTENKTIKSLAQRVKDLSDENNHLRNLYKSVIIEKQ